MCVGGLDTEGHGRLLYFQAIALCLLLATVASQVCVTGNCDITVANVQKLKNRYLGRRSKILLGPET